MFTIYPYLHWHACPWTPLWSWTQNPPCHVRRRLCEYCTHSLWRRLEWGLVLMELQQVCPPGSVVGSGLQPGLGISCSRGPWVTSGPKAPTQGWSNGWGRWGPACHWRRRDCSSRGWWEAGSRALPLSHRCGEGSPPWQRLDLPGAGTACWCPGEVRQGNGSERISLSLKKN